MIVGTQNQGPIASGTSRNLEADLREMMPALLSYFIRRIRPHEDAADCLSELLIVVWKRRSSLPDDSDSRRAWIYVAARNVLANQRRSSGRKIKLVSRLRSELLTQASPADGLSSSLEEALATISADDRELVQLVVWDGFSIAEAGATLGLRPDAARARYSRARARLRRALDPDSPPLVDRIEQN